VKRIGETAYRRVGGREKRVGETAYRRVGEREKRVGVSACRRSASGRNGSAYRRVGGSAR
jgi:hypothetical protein